MLESSQSDREDSRLEWLRAAIESLDGVASAELEFRGNRVVLNVRLASEGALTNETGSPTEDPELDTLLEANVAIMLIFDIETLAITGASQSAAELLGLPRDRLAEFSLADLHTQGELERLGAVLVETPVGWADVGTWEMRTARDSISRLRVWHGPTGRDTHRLLVAAE